MMALLADLGLLENLLHHGLPLVRFLSADVVR